MTEISEGKLKRQEEMKFVDERRGRIRKAISENGQFTHNKISCILRSVSNTVDYIAANDLVDEFDLDVSYGMEKVAQ